MTWYSSQTRIRLLAPEDPDERGPPTIEQIYDMQLASPAHLMTDIAGELVRDAKTLWEKLRDGIACTNHEVMAAVDSLCRKAQPEWVPPHSSVPITSQCQGGFAAFAGNVNGSSRASDASCKATYDSSNDSRCANLTLARRICTICSQGILTIPRVEAEFIGQGGFTLLGGPTQSVPLHAPTYGTNPWQGQSMDYGGSFRPELMSGFRPYTASYGDMSSFGGGSSSVTQPTQPEDGDLQGNDNDPLRSNRERHEPNRLSLLGPRHATGGRKKTTKKRADTSRTMTDHDDE
uniref:Uncharacterized protein n=1 Tax=Oryza punctata TaxID=4537 RepID=A0A0E0LKQ4_ORYPU